MLKIRTAFSTLEGPRPEIVWQAISQVDFSVDRSQKYIF